MANNLIAMNKKNTSSYATSSSAYLFFLKKSHNNLYIFNKYINNKYKLIPFNEKINYSGKTKYFPSVSKE